MSATLSTPSLVGLFLTFVRILAVMMTAPIFSSRSIPAIVKIGTAGILASILMPVTSAGGPRSPVPAGVLPFSIAVAQEILIGVLIGLVSNLVFVAVTMAAGMMGIQIGFRAANLFDPLMAVPTSALEQFYTLLAAVLFLTINGHHWLLLALAQTFAIVPLGSFVPGAITIERLIALTGETFVAATRIALPVVGAMLLADAGLGLLARAVPQIQVFFLGIPLKIGLGLLVLGFTLVFTLPLVRDLLGNSAGNVLAISGR